MAYKRKVKGRPTLSVEKKEANKKARDEVQMKVDISSEIIQRDAKKRREAARKGRFDMGGLTGQKLMAPNREGYKRRWVNDDDKGKLDQALDKGYYFLQETTRGDEYIPTSDLGARKSQRVGTKEDGSALHAYLMEIPLELYQETQQEKEAAIRELEDQIRRGKANGGVEKAYSPSGSSNYIDKVENG